MSASPFPDFRTLYVLGAGGCGRGVAWQAMQCWGDRIDPVFVVDDDYATQGSVNGIPVRALSSLVANDDARFVGAIGNCAVRRRLVGACLARGLRPTTVVHPRVELGPGSSLAEGVVIYSSTVVMPNVSIAGHVHVNVGCTVGHDASIGEFSTLSPGVNVAGYVDIGKDVFIGVGASVINGTSTSPMTIGDGAVVAAGACVTRPVAAGALVAGVPATRKR